MAWRKECKVSSDIPRQGQEFDRLLRSTVGALSLENAEQDTLKHAQSMLWDYQATPEMSAPPQRIRVGNAYHTPIGRPCHEHKTTTLVPNNCLSDRTQVVAGCRYLMLSQLRFEQADDR